MQKVMLFSKVEVLPARQKESPRVTDFLWAVAGGCADANVAAELLNVLCAQTIRFCYCMRTMLANVFFAFAAKFHFVCILPMYLVPPSWLQGVLLSSDRIKMQIRSLQFAHIVKTQNYKHLIYFRLPIVPPQPAVPPPIRPPNIISQMVSFSFAFEY